MVGTPGAVVRALTQLDVAGVDDGELVHCAILLVSAGSDESPAVRGLLLDFGAALIVAASERGHALRVLDAQLDGDLE